MIVMYDARNSKALFSFIVPQKGENEYAIMKSVQYITKILGYRKFIFKGDQEPALRTLMDRVSRLCGEQVIFEESPVGESQSNGAIENAVQRIQGQYRSMKSDLETRYGKKIPSDHPALVCLVMHAGLTMFRFTKGSDGNTAYRRLKGKEFTKPYLKFGECVWYLKPKSKGKQKANYRWDESIFLGIREESGECLVGNERGVIKE